LKKKHQNIFFIIGLIVLALMVTQLNFNEVCEGVRRAGYWFLAVVALWAVLYLFNTAAWWIIINSQSATQSDRQPSPVSFLWLYKITVSGFALNYATPGGLMGGEPYKIMSLSPKIGTERATSSVILHTMTHIFSHFWFWLIACILFVMTEPLNVLTSTVLLLVTLFCLTAIWFFIKGYRKGIARTVMTILSHIPLVKAWAQRMTASHSARLTTIDHQIASLHNQNRRTFVLAVMLELSCRIVSALEIMFVLLVIMPEANYIQCILILAFTSLIANMLFFIPLQLGGREGGFLMSVNGLGMTASAGIFVALIVRLRELIWTGIGLLLIKIERSGKKYASK
jgi:uncharacterized membrane protein YbhN (UPF0104 family)